MLLKDHHPYRAKQARKVDELEVAITKETGTNRSEEAAHGSTDAYLLHQDATVPLPDTALIEMQPIPPAR